MTAPPALTALLSEYSAHEPAPALCALRDSLLSRYGNSLQAILYYGSCLRGGDPFDGLVDLYVIVDRYRHAYGKRLPAWANALLPPNVFYLEKTLPEGTVRCKYAVLSLRDLTRGTCTCCFHSYIWARFAQPMGVLYCRDEDSARRLYRDLARAVTTFIRRVIPRLPERFTIADLWQRGLALTYRAELRVEKGHRGLAIHQHHTDYYQAISAAVLERLPQITVEHQTDGDYYRAKLTGWQRRVSGFAWGLRTVQGKLLSLLRLLKAFFTFEGGLDYIIWKLERHSGVSIEVTPRLRRYPLIFIWGLMWRLYRQGVFR